MKEFKYEITSIDPNKLLDQNGQTDFDSFFLILSMIYNDIKGLIFFDLLLKETYRQPKDAELTSHAGEYSGLRIQLRKLMIGTAVGFLEFVRKNDSLISAPQFQLILKKIPKDRRKIWTDIYLSATGKSANSEETLFSILSRIRSNIAFHYDIHNKELRTGFVQAFHNKNNLPPQYQKAYFSPGVNMEETRYYYADASTEKYISNILEGREDEISKTISDANLFITAVMNVYLNSKK